MSWNNDAEAASLALDTVPLCVKRIDGSIVHWSSANQRLYGWSMEEAVGQNIDCLLQTLFPCSPSVVEEELTRTGQWEGELKRQTKEGVTVWVTARWTRLIQGAHESLRIIEISMDITAAKRNEDDLRHFAAIVSSSDDAIICKDCFGLITSWNPAAEQLFEYTAAEIIGRNVTLLFPPEVMAEEQQILTQLARGERIDHYETIRVSKSGRRIAVALSISPIFDSKGDFIGAAKIVRDISQSRQWAEALRVSEERKRLAVEAADLGLWMFKVDGEGSEWDGTCRAIFGLSPVDPTPNYEEAIALIHPEDRADLERQFICRLRNGWQFHAECRVLGRDFQLRWVAIRGRPSFERIRSRSGGVWNHHRHHCA